jgi:NTE family protein
MDKIKAYAVFDGGGVKGAALAGALEAAELHMEFQGYGGTSAGGIVALLASVGYTGEDLSEILTKELKLAQMLGAKGGSFDSLTRLSTLASCLQGGSALSKVRAAWNCRHLFKRLDQHLGLYSARGLQEFLTEKIKQKFPDLKHRGSITFRDLKDRGCPPLKILASDIRLRGPRIFDAERYSDFGVVDAVRASMCYPFVFEPVYINENRLVDGGLSSNLPVFLFRNERRRTGWPVIAFDLISDTPGAGETYRLKDFSLDLLATALESSEHILEQVVDEVYPIPILTPAGIDTLKFGLSEDDLESLRNSGYRQAHDFISEHLAQWTDPASAGPGGQRQARKQAQYLPPRQVIPVLKAFAEAFEQGTSARGLRAHIMLPDNDELVVAYQYGMDGDPDAAMRMPIEGGCAGRAWNQREIIAVDLEDAQHHLADFGLTREHQDKVRADRRSAVSIPMFYVGKSAFKSLNVGDLPLFGILSLDSATPLDDTGWTTAHRDFVRSNGVLWSDILSSLLQ